MSNATCEKCGAAPGTSYSFHYGRTARPADGPSYRSDVYATASSLGQQQYQIGGIDAAILCASCLTKARARRAAEAVLHDWLAVPAVAVVHVVWLAAVVGAAALGSWIVAAILLAAGVVVTAVVYARDYLSLEKADFAEHTAVELHLDELRDRGWDTFWTMNEFASRAPH